MVNEKIIIIGDEEIVLLFGLLGIEGVILENPNDFLKAFNNSVANPSIGMVIIAIDLSDDKLDFVLDYKINNRKPFVFYLPNLFKETIEKKDIFLKKLSKTISKIIS